MCVCVYIHIYIHVPILIYLLCLRVYIYTRTNITNDMLFCCILAFIVSLTRKVMILAFVLACAHFPCCYTLTIMRHSRIHVLAFSHQFCEYAFRSQEAVFRQFGVKMYVLVVGKDVHFLTYTYIICIHVFIHTVAHWARAHPTKPGHDGMVQILKVNITSCAFVCWFSIRHSLAEIFHAQQVVTGYRKLFPLHSVNEARNAHDDLLCLRHSCEHTQGTMPT